MVVENKDHVGQELGLRLDIIKGLDTKDAMLHKKSLVEVKLGMLVLEFL